MHTELSRKIGDYLGELYLRGKIILKWNLEK